MHEAERTSGELKSSASDDESFVEQQMPRLRTEKKIKGEGGGTIYNEAFAETESQLNIFLT